MLVLGCVNLKPKSTRLKASLSDCCYHFAFSLQPQTLRFLASHFSFVRSFIGARRDSSSEIADDDDDNAMMSVIEEVPEESDSLIENAAPTRRASDDLSSASSGTEDSSNTGCVQ